MTRVTLSLLRIAVLGLASVTLSACGTGISVDWGRGPWGGPPAPIPTAGLRAWYIGDSAHSQTRASNTAIASNETWAAEPGWGNPLTLFGSGSAPLNQQVFLNNHFDVGFVASNRLGAPSSGVGTTATLYLALVFNPAADGSIFYLSGGSFSTTCAGTAFLQVDVSSGMLRGQVCVGVNPGNLDTLTAVNGVNGIGPFVLLLSWQSGGTRLSGELWNVNGAVMTLLNAGNVSAGASYSFSGELRLGGTYYQGGIAEVILYDRLPSDQEVIDLKKYLGTKYGFTLN